jgi:hypothetical protein
VLEADVEVDRREFTVAVTLAVEPGGRAAPAATDGGGWCGAWSWGG